MYSNSVAPRTRLDQTTRTQKAPGGFLGDSAWEMEHNRGGVIALGAAAGYALLASLRVIQQRSLSAPSE